MMDNLLFMIWMLLYPLVSTIGSYIGDKNRKMMGKDTPSDEVYAVASFVSIIIYIIVAGLLYKH